MHAVHDPSKSTHASVTHFDRPGTGTTPIQVCLFGGLTLLKEGTPVKWRGGPRTEALLQTLALQERQGVPRETLLAHVWPDSDPSLAAQSLHTLLHSLHRMLADAIDGALPVVHNGEMYRLNLEAGIVIDVTVFDALAHHGDQAWRTGSWSVAAEAYRDAVRLYRGDLRACTDDVAVVERERLRASYLVMLGRLADLARRSSDFSSALDYASLVLRYDAGREDAHRTLMLCYAQLGQRVQAMRQYLLCERLLRDTFDAVPEPATTALYDRLRLEPGVALEDEPEVPQYPYTDHTASDDPSGHTHVRDAHSRV